MLLTERKTIKPYSIQPVNENEKPLYLKKGQLCMISIYSLHKDEKYFPNANKFDPERFSEENKKDIYPGAYIPFGVGPRNCIGDN